VTAGRASEAGGRPADPRAARGLNEQEIVEAALRLAGRVGFGGLSMRGLAEELDVTPMAIYYHVGNKKALLALVTDSILRDIRVPSVEAGDWTARLLMLHEETSRVVGPYPGIDAMMIDLGLTEQGRRLMDANIQILLDAGFSERGALLAYNVLHSYGVGRVTIESRLRGRPRPAGRDVSDWPALTRISGAVAGLHAVDYRTFGYEAIVSGLQELLAASRTEQGGPLRP
jgi:TetR/AcrR family transcriptional regulator, tetracycline repressor protein